ncbi:MAG: bifunctional riboflavin kinase/FAD synthetase [Dehalococcoidia bacterium]
MLLVREELRRSRTAGDHAISIGVFDGVHRGHEELVRHLLAEAASRGLTGGIVTFHPSPITVLRPDIPLSYLESLEQRVELLRQLGVEFVAVLQFTSEVAQVSARDFIRLLVEEANMRLLVVGEDFALGRGREGTAERLREFGEEDGFEVVTVPLLAAGDDRVSSTRVRKALAAGKMEEVAELLGRSYTLRGPVVHGDERGRAIGIPTLNIGVSPDRALPPNGVYVTRATLPDGRQFKACTNIGMQPTFDGTRWQVETHLLDFEGDLYDAVVSIELLQRLRDEHKFDGVDALLKQIHADLDETRAYFAKTGQRV